MDVDQYSEGEPPVSYALRYAAAGLSVVPIECDGTKKPPQGQAWKHLQERIATEAEVRRMFPGKKGVAVICGKVSGNLETLDIDAPELVEPFEAAVREIAPGLLETLSTVATPRNNYGGRHYRYRLDGEVAGNTKLAQTELLPQFNDDATPLLDPRTSKQKLSPDTLIETRGEGGYAIVPGSPPECHETGLPYKLIAGPPLEEIATITAEQHRILWHVAKSFNRYVDQRDVKDGPAGPKDGKSPGDDFAARASWDDILVPSGWTKDRTSGELTFWCRPGKSKGISATTGVRSSSGTELLCVFSTNAFPFEGPANGRTCSSYSKFAAYAVLNNGGDFTAAAKDLSAKGYGDQPKPKSSPAKPAPKLILPEPFRPFPVETLPEPLRTLVVAGAKSIGCDTSFIALPLLTAVAAAIGNSRRLLAKRGWTVPPILWTAIVGESGTAKTPAFKLAVKAMRERQRKALLRQDEEEKRYVNELAVYEKQYSAWKQNKKSVEEPPQKPEPPLAERCIVSDTTVEALAPILKANPRGLMLARDELNGWLGSFDRYAGGKGGADASHWLSMHNGETIIVDRRTGQPRTIFVPQASICVTGGIQPGILNKALGREHRESGLCARLLLACPPRKAKRWTEDEIDPQLEDSIARLVDWLYDLRPAINDDGQVKPVVIGMTKEARAAWKEFYGTHAEQMADLSGEMAAAFNKLEEAACRLALVVHYARWAAGDESITDDGPLDLKSMEAGITLCEWFKAETARVYSILEESPESLERRRLMEWIERKGGNVTVRDLTHGPRSYRGQPETAEVALNDLVGAGAGTWEFLPPSELGGRPTRLFRLISANPGPETTTDIASFEGFGSGASSREVKNEVPDEGQGEDEWTG
jgi:hypothetical protein